MTHGPVPCQECTEGRHRLCEYPSALLTMMHSRGGYGDRASPESKMCCDEEVCWTYLIETGFDDSSSETARASPLRE